MWWVIHRETTSREASSAFSRFVFVHESFFVDVQKGTTVPTASFGHQDIGGNDPSGVELNGLGVSQGDDTGIERNDGTSRRR